MKFFIEMRESVINFKFYNDVRKNRYGKVFGYLALLLLIVYTLLGVSTYIYANKAIEGGISYLKTETPEFSVADGILDWKGQPQQFLFQENGLTVAVDVDNTLDEAKLDSENNSYFIFTKNGILMKSTMQKQKVAYKDISPNFTKDDMMNLLGSGRIVVIVATVLFFPFYYGIKLLNVLLLACIAAISASILKLKISWKENFIISGYALTLPVLLMLLFSLAGYGFPMFAYWIISILYVIMAQRYIRFYEQAVAEGIRVAQLKEKEEMILVPQEIEGVVEVKELTEAPAETNEIGENTIDESKVDESKAEENKTDENNVEENSHEIEKKEKE